ncbi:MAG: sugar MFS transporter [Saprospiraceae bacterium]|jgi:glucose/galactose transporter|nr:sugar MFS transporter [Saprospiraceae bacterium]MBK7370692.1 sugar MFS transporter [Saprospiraceae bacterium]MBK7436761.1 sugar MFS transporter [Saprospiraceae bacterium]MBK7608211.1 sugar MFS transporter [Saprospiraceae bacterium]MBK8279268.1 sugar MFS transporter [Saprospiraceae bacterium]
MESTQNQITTNTQKNSFGPIIIIGILFFIFGFITWANSSLIPYLKIACELTTSQAILVTFAFYISYAFMAFPSAWVLKKTGYKNGMVVGLLVMALGALVFIPAASARSFDLFLFGLFVIGGGMALLQTASNPYITILGPIESAAKRISIMGVFNKAAGALAPIVLGAIILKDSSALQARLATMEAAAKTAELELLASKVVMPYVSIAIALILLSIFIYKSSIPEIRAEGEDDQGPNTINRKSIFDYPYLWLGFITLFLYVGAEVLSGDIIQIYGNSLGIPLDIAKYFTTYTMIGLLTGYIIGIFTIPKYLSQSTALKGSAVLGLIFSALAMFTDGYMSVLFIALLGLANALIWPAIWPLAIEGLGKFTRTGSALLIVGIAGGAIIPRVWAILGESIGLKSAFVILIPCYLFVLYFATYGHKIGKTVTSK